jgi:hypothetical protein
VGYGLVIRETYEGYIPTWSSSKIGKFLRSRDKRFSVKHGSITKSQALTLKWRKQEFRFSNADLAQSNMTENGMMYEYYYWVCIQT